MKIAEAIINEFNKSESIMITTDLKLYHYKSLDNNINNFEPLMSQKKGNIIIFSTQFKLEPMETIVQYSQRFKSDVFRSYRNKEKKQNTKMWVPKNQREKEDLTPPVKKTKIVIRNSKNYKKEPSTPIMVSKEEEERNYIIFSLQFFCHFLIYCTLPILAL